MRLPPSLGSGGSCDLAQEISFHIVKFLNFWYFKAIMMTANVFVIANVKQLRTDGSFRILLFFFFQTSWAVGVLNSAMFNSFHNRVEFGTILEGLRNFGGRGGVEDHKPPPSVRHRRWQALVNAVKYSRIQ